MRFRLSGLSFFAAIATGVVLTGCLETTTSDNVQSRAVYQSYRVSYSAETSTLTAHAQFLVGGSLGTTLSLRGPSRVSFDGRDLSEHSFLGTYYSSDLRGPFSPGHSWTWIDPDGKSYANQASIVPFEVVRAESRWQATGAYVVTISGPVATAEDRFDAWFSQQTPQGSQSASVQVRVLDGSRIAIQAPNPTRPTGSESLVNGPARLTLSRNRSVALQQATEEGGRIETGYSAYPFTVEIVR